MTPVGSELVGKADEVDAVVDARGGDGDALLVVRPVERDAALREAREGEVRQGVGRLATRADGERLVRHVVVGPEAHRRERAVLRVGERRELDREVHRAEPPAARAGSRLRVERADEDVVVRVERAHEDGALRRGAAKVAAAADGAVAVERAEEVDRRDGGHARADDDAHRVEAHAARRREQRVGRVVLGEKDLDRAVLVDGHDVVGRDAIDVARVHLGKVLAPNQNAVLVVEALARGLEDVRLHVGVVFKERTIDLGARCHGAQPAARGGRGGRPRLAPLDGVALGRGQAQGLALVHRPPRVVAVRRRQVGEGAGALIIVGLFVVLDPLPVQVEPVANDDVREVVIVKVSHRGHARRVHRRAHDGRRAKALGDRGGLHVVRLVPQPARLRVPAAEHAARVVAGVRLHPAVGAIGDGEVWRVAPLEEAARARIRLRRIGREVEAPAALKRPARGAALGLGAQRHARVAQVAIAPARAGPAERRLRAAVRVVRVAIGGVVAVLHQVVGRCRHQQVVAAPAAVEDQVGAEAHDLGDARVGHVKVRTVVLVDAGLGRLGPLPVAVVVGLRVEVQRAPRVPARLAEDGAGVHVVARARLGAQLGAADAVRGHGLVLDRETRGVVPVGALGHVGNARVIVSLALVRLATQRLAAGGRVEVARPVHRAVGIRGQPGIVGVGAILVVLGVAIAHLALAAVNAERRFRAATLVVGHVGREAVRKVRPARLHELVLDLLEVGEVARRARLGLRAVRAQKLPVVRLLPATARLRRHPERHAERALAAVGAHVLEHVRRGPGVPAREVEVGLVGHDALAAGGDDVRVDVDGLVVVLFVVVGVRAGPLVCREVLADPFRCQARALRGLRAAAARGLHAVGRGGHPVADRSCRCHHVRKVQAVGVGRHGRARLARVVARNRDARHALGHAPAAVGDVGIGLARVLARRVEGVRQAVLADAVDPAARVVGDVGAGLVGEEGEAAPAARLVRAVVALGDRRGGIAGAAVVAHVVAARCDQGAGAAAGAAGVVEGFPIRVAKDHQVLVHAARPQMRAQVAQRLLLAFHRVH